jgi:hypothetical protein
MGADISGFTPDHLLDFVRLLDKTEGVELRKVVVRKKGDGWQMVLAVTKKGSPVVTFVDGQTWQETWEHFFFLLRSGSFRWFPDRFAA